MVMKQIKMQYLCLQHHRSDAMALAIYINKYTDRRTYSMFRNKLNMCSCVLSTIYIVKFEYANK